MACRPQAVMSFICPSSYTVIFFKVSFLTLADFFQKVYLCKTSLLACLAAFLFFITFCNFTVVLVFKYFSLLYCFPVFIVN